jgi:hypothetical protein
MAAAPGEYKSMCWAALSSVVSHTILGRGVSFESHAELSSSKTNKNINRMVYN